MQRLIDGGPLLLMLLGGLLSLFVLLAVIAIFLTAIVRIFKIAVNPTTQQQIIGYLADPKRIVLGSGIAFTIIFGIPAFIAALYSGTSPEEKTFAMDVVRWLLGGWGLGGGVSLVVIVFGKDD